MHAPFPPDTLADSTFGWLPTLNLGLVDRLNDGFGALVPPGLASLAPQPGEEIEKALSPAERAWLPTLLLGL
jgi:hypothetical protein